jgi:hypothetical protein
MQRHSYARVGLHFLRRAFRSPLLVRFPEGYYVLANLDEVAGEIIKAVAAA